MSKFNNDILIRNISMLMMNNSVTQEKMAQVIGMSQPNFNHAIHNTNGKRFTIEQIFDISNYFGVSVDWLMGNQEGIAITPRAAADFITKAVTSGAAKLTRITVKEDNYCADEFTPPGSMEITTVKYWAVYFPTYENIKESAKSEEEFLERLVVAKAVGNETPYWSLNAFLDKYQRFYELWRTGSMDEEDFQTLVTKHLDKIEEQ